MTCVLGVTNACKWTSHGAEYHGGMNETKSGIPCQRWDSQYPIAHNFTTLEFFPNELPFDDVVNITDLHVCNNRSC